MVNSCEGYMRPRDAGRNETSLGYEINVDRVHEIGASQINRIGFYMV